MCCSLLCRARTVVGCSECCNAPGHRAGTRYSSASRHYVTSQIGSGSEAEPRHSCSSGEAGLQGTEYQWALSFGLVLSVQILDRIRRYLHREKSRGVDLEGVAAAETQHGGKRLRRLPA